MTDHVAAREHLVQALHADLVGPYAGAAASDTAAEVLPLPPSRWYLTGFLAPEEGREHDDPTEADTLGAGSDEDEIEGTAAEPEPRRRSLFPASLGLSVLIPEPRPGDQVVVTVRWADYLRVPWDSEQRMVLGDEGSGEDEEAHLAAGDGSAAGGRRGRYGWQRLPRVAEELPVPLDPATLGAGIDVPDSGGVQLQGLLKPAQAPGLPEGTQALSLFVVNRRAVPGEAVKGPRDESFLFQVSLELSAPHGLVPRPNRRDEFAPDGDDRVSDLQFRERSEWGVGHGVAVEVGEGEGESEGPVRTVRTTWLPQQEIRRVTSHAEPGVVVSMEALGALDGPDAVRAALERLPAAYLEWIGTQRAVEVGGSSRTEMRDVLMERAERAAERIGEGIELLAGDPQVLRAFTLANQAMAASARQRSPERYTDGKVPEWRLFQLAFVLLSLPSTVKADHGERDLVELIYFPTGGGKTEAYLGLVACTLVLRRLRGVGTPHRGLGTAIILRYTLRLLTLDQLGRAATLICALELLRQERPDELGEERLTVGLWVGRSATANTIKAVVQQVTDYKNQASARSPFPLAQCPWCGDPITPASLHPEPKTRPTKVVAACVSPTCPFMARRNPSGLPVVFVDEQVYRELPAFLVATVDKFAMLPWRGETGMLFGRVTARRGEELFGPLDGKPPRSTALPDGLPPPELVIQDELHLISGPLGTMVGLYETAIEWLATAQLPDGKPARPKVIASTATVRRASDQIRALFGRDQVALFPPPGVDENESWFATVDTTSPGRLYVGVAAGGRSLKGTMLRTYGALVGAAQHRFEEEPQAADPYMTLVGYFNSLRELGGMRRLVEDDVRQRASRSQDRRPLDTSPDDQHLWMANRTVHADPLELTSRESTAAVTRAKARLEQVHGEKGAVDVLLASNMISVGVDIDRLGLMVVAGQPKTTSEYIQASSRVGRQFPGLVVTCLSLNKPRDRSHYERFGAYHESFYRFVEATSLTPFSGPALERGLAAVLLAMARFADPELTSSAGLMAVDSHQPDLEKVAETLARRAGRQPGSNGAEKEASSSVKARCQNLAARLVSIVQLARENAGVRIYSPFDTRKDPGKPLLWSVSDEQRPDPADLDAAFPAPTSMRDVEQSAHLWLRFQLGGKGGGGN